MLDNEPKYRSETRYVLVALIDPSPTNPRKNFSDDASLAASIKEKGLIQPIVIVPKGDGRFEIVAGERRWRAHRRLMLDVIEAKIIYDLPIREAREIQLIENCQRRDLDFFEEADGFMALMADFKYGVRELARRLGKSAGYISQMKDLAVLEPAIRVAAMGDKAFLTKTHCFMLARVPIPADRMRLFRLCQTERLSTRDLEREVEQLQVELSKQDFKPNELFPMESPIVSTTCIGCEFHTASNRLRYGPDIRGDICHNPQCAAEKNRRVVMVRLKESEREGYVVLDERRGEELTIRGRTLTPYAAGIYIELDDRLAADTKYRTVRQLLGERPDGVTIYQTIPRSTGRLLEFVERGPAFDYIERVHGFSPSGDPRDASEEYQAAIQERRESQKRFLLECCKLIEASFSKLRPGDPQANQAGFLELVDYHRDAIRYVLARREVEYDKDIPERALIELARGLSRRKAKALLFEVLFAHHAWNFAFHGLTELEPNARAYLQLCEIDWRYALRKIRQQVHRQATQGKGNIEQASSVAASQPQT